MPITIPPAHASTATRPAHASVAFLRIPGFDTRPVAEQAAAKQALEARARDAIAGFAAADRAVLDADDGVALVLFGDPARALETIESLAARGDPLQAGLNYGPLALTAKGGDGRVFGDGLAAAAAAARFAAPERTLITDEFRRALAATNPVRAASLAPAGDFTDTRVRLHSLYAVDRAGRRAERRRILRQAVAGVAAILFLGVSARVVRHVFFPTEPATVTLAIRPRGEVWVDGAPRGRSPPLTELELPPGRHVIVVRFPGAPPYETELRLKAGERRTLAHSFAGARQEPKGGFWRDLRRRFGGS